jgi:hypothetical protein
MYEAGNTHVGRNVVHLTCGIINTEFLPFPANHAATGGAVPAGRMKRFPQEDIVSADKLRHLHMEVMSL